MSSTEAPENAEDGGDDGSGPTPAQTAVMVLSGVIALALFGYAVWQIVLGVPTAPPEATVAATEPLANGRVAVTVELRNPSDRGLVRATVESNCTTPPVTAEFSYVPADDIREATVVCPNGTTDPTVEVTTWARR